VALPKKSLYSKYYDNFSSFKQAINDCLALTHTSYKNELDSLLSLNFQSFYKAQYHCLKYIPAILHYLHALITTPSKIQILGLQI